MAIRICTSDEGAWLYESCSMRPINTEAFKDEDEAEAFLLLASRRGVSIGNADAATLERLQDELRALPICRDCDERIVNPGEVRPEEQCADCCESERYDNAVAQELGQ